MPGRLTHLCINRRPWPPWAARAGLPAPPARPAPPASSAGDRGREGSDNAADGVADTGAGSETSEATGCAAEVRDDGPEWDPRAAPPPDLDAALEDRRVGGLGLHLVRNLVSELDWRRDGAENVTSVVKRW